MPRFSSSPITRSKRWSIRCFFAIDVHPDRGEVERLLLGQLDHLPVGDRLRKLAAQCRHVGHRQALAHHAHDPEQVQPGALHVDGVNADLEGLANSG